MEVLEHTDGRLQIRYQGEIIPCRQAPPRPGVLRASHGAMAPTPQQLLAQFKPVINTGRQQLLDAGHVVGLRFARRNGMCRAAFRALGRHGNHLVAPNIGTIREPGGLRKAWTGEAGKWMRRLSSRCTGPFRIFTLTSLRCLAAGRRGTTAVITSRPCRSSPGNGATPRICRRRFRRQPG